MRNEILDLASGWKPSFLSDNEFIHLMLEAADGFVLVLSLEEHGRIIYASDGIAWLLGHLPTTLMENSASIFDLTAEEDAPIIKDILDQSALNRFMEEEEQPQMEFFVHMEKGGVNKCSLKEGQNRRPRHELVRLSGFFTKWNLPCDVKNCNNDNACTLTGKLSEKTRTLLSLEKSFLKLIYIEVLNFS